MGILIIPMKKATRTEEAGAVRTGKEAAVTDITWDRKMEVVFV